MNLGGNSSEEVKEVLIRAGKMRGRESGEETGI